MSIFTEMLSTHKRASGGAQSSMAECIEACVACESACNMCADACLGEEHLDMLRRCIRTNLECANLCTAVRQILERQTETDSRLFRPLLQAMIVACTACAEECDKHAKMHEHCRICAEVCRRCADACQRVSASAASLAA